MSYTMPLSFGLLYNFLYNFVYSFDVKYKYNITLNCYTIEHIIVLK